jgi:hypothetical protein
MSFKITNSNKANICGWGGCVVGGFSILAKIFSVYVLTTVGTNPATMPYVLHMLQADLLSAVVGLPLGLCAWVLNRRGLGAMAIVLCISTIALGFIHR